MKINWHEAREYLAFIVIILILFGVLLIDHHPY
jgi:uncharacterized Rmd1/YagE family protein